MEVTIQKIRPVVEGKPLEDKKPFWMIVASSPVVTVIEDDYSTWSAEELEAKAIEYEGNSKRIYESDHKSKMFALEADRFYTMAYAARRG